MGRAKRRKQEERAGESATAPHGAEGAPPPAPPRPPIRLVREPGPFWLRPALTLLALIYLGSIFANASKMDGARGLLPPAPRFFVQSACLFPHAARAGIEYRLEGWDCDAGAFVELDTRPYFPIHPDDKENRLHRLAFFHRRNRPAMEALERYVLERASAASAVEGGRRLGGVRLLSLRHPIPPVGSAIARFERRPLHVYPASQRRDWFYTPVSRRLAHCADAPVSPEPAASEDP
jgi:hypothetical protein